MVKVSAPGKLMLFGEYSVVFGGKCIVTAVEPRFDLTASKANTDGLRSPDLTIAEYTDPKEVGKQGAFVHAALTAARTNSKVPFLQVETHSNAKLNGQKIGLGSSSASVVTTLAAANYFSTTPIDKDTLFQRARNVVLEVQGSGSGFDTAASVYGGTFLYTKENGMVQSLPKLDLIVAFTGQSADTKSLVAEVEEDRKKRPDHYTQLFTKVEAIVDNAVKALNENNLKEVGVLMNQNHELLKQIGPGENGVTTQEIENIIQAAKDAGAYGAKLSGAGKGDCIIAVAPPEKREAIEAAIKNAGGSPLNIKTHAQGVRQDEFKATARANANIALIKYWGKRDTERILPMNGSVSITYDDKLSTTTTVEFKPNVKEDQLIFQNNPPQADNRVSGLLDLLRKKAGIEAKAIVTTTNSFPTAAGFASSASGMAALVAAGAKAAHLNLSEKELSMLARQGSGSATRSIHGGFVEWQKGSQDDGSDSYGIQLHEESFWPNLRIVVIQVDAKEKDVSSRTGMQQTVETSKIYTQRMLNVETRMQQLKQAIAQKDFETLATLTMQDSDEFVATLQDTIPPISYLQPPSKHIMQEIKSLNEGKIIAAYTFDAGPNPIIITEEDHIPKIKNLVEKTSGATVFSVCKVGGPVEYLD